MPTYDVPHRQFSPDDERALENICTGGIIYELGCWTGKSTSILAKKGNVTVVDTFEGSPGTMLADYVKNHNVRDIFERNMREEGLKVNIIQERTEKAVKSVKNESIDFLFIDADHRYAGIKRDLDLWVPKVKQGGMIAGHDCEKRLDEIDFDIEPYLEQDTVKGLHVGVIKAVFEKFSDVKLWGRIWYTKK